MARITACFSSLLLIVGGCDFKSFSDAGSEAADVAISVDATAGLDTVANTDAAAQPDTASEDAAPDTSGLVCTGRPIPDGLTCTAQEPDLASHCDGRGGVVFDGTHCVPSRGALCGTGERGAFDSLEECGVTCAAAGQCDLLAFFVPPEWQSPPQFCGEVPYECQVMGLQHYDRVSADCAVWGPFSTGAVSPVTHPFPEHWELLYSLTLASPTLGRVICSDRSL